MKNYISLILKEDVRFLTTLLGDTIREQEGEAFFKKIEDIRKLAVEIRENPNKDKIHQQKAMIESLTLDEAYKVARAFGIYFQLVNIAEERQRIRRLQEYSKDQSSLLDMSLRKVFHDLKEKKVPVSEITKLLAEMEIELVLTAHPTEAKRRSVLDHLLHIAFDLSKLGDDDLPLIERNKNIESIQTTLEILWQTSEIRQRKVEVVDEIDHTLFYFRRTILNLTNNVYENTVAEFKHFYGDEELKLRPFLYFGSWVGADRDGNPNVTSDVTKEAVRRQRKMILKFYLDTLQSFIRILSQSVSLANVSKPLLDSLKKDARLLPKVAKSLQNYELTEIYRQKVTFIHQKLQNTLIGKGRGYASVDEFKTDIGLMLQSLEKNKGGLAGQHFLKTLLWKVETFGFYLARIDFRDHSRKIRQTLAELFPGDEVMDKDFLLNQIEGEKKKSHTKKFSPETKDILEQLKTFQEIQAAGGEQLLSDYIISMTENANDILALFYLAKRQGLISIKNKKVVKADINIVPLFEVIDILDRSHEILDQLFSIPLYRQYLKTRGNFQQVMLGYSDSSKDGGYLAANWKIYAAQKKLLATAQKHKVRLQIFHGKGGTIDRGGGQSHKAILAQPAAAPWGQIKITEQGEVISQKYSNPITAERNIEQLITAVLWTNLVSYKEIVNDPRIPVWEKRLETLSAYSLRFYRELIGTNGFVEFYNQATPVQILEFAKIGSRPVRRGAKKELKDLRAIPWVFSWIQSRYIISSWYGVGYAIEQFIHEYGHQAIEELREMYIQWPYFKSVIDNAQISLEKTEMYIAEQYGELVQNKTIRDDIMQQIYKEYQRSVEMLMEVSGDKKLLGSTPILKNSIRLRSPYIDPLHYIQIRFLKEIRRPEFSSKSENTRVQIHETLLLTMNGIAAGMKSTG
jgi:phosphoenolpyruvate carboxylase